MTRIRDYFFIGLLIGLLNLLFLFQLVGLYFETIREGHTWIWFFFALILVTIVNIGITLGGKIKIYGLKDKIYGGLQFKN